MIKYDVIIKNGLVFDGKGNPPRNVDIGINGDKIKEIGDLQTNVAGKIIDAKGKYVTPGFIDLTNHSDTHWTIFTSPSQESLLRQGITTVLGGNCGSSLAPFIGASEDEIERWVDSSEININWRTVDEFFEVLSSQKLGVNFATLVGFNTLQKAVLGDSPRDPDKGDINQIKLLLKAAMDSGVFGLSTNLGLASARIKDDEDIIDIFEIVRDFGGIVKHHLEDEGENILPALSRVIKLAGRSKTRLHITHFKSLGRKSWELFSSAINMLRVAGQDKMNISVDIFPYTKTGSSLLMFLPSWFRDLSTEEQKKVLVTKDGARRAVLLADLKKMTLHYNRIIVASAGELSKVGKTIDTLSLDSGLSGDEVILNLLMLNNLRVSIFNEVISEENIMLIAKEEFTAFSSDGVGYSLPSSFSGNLPHPRSFGAFPRAMNLFVKNNSMLSWEDVIFRMSGLPAGIIGIKNRGIITEGAKADIVIFSPEDISDKATYEEPFQYSEGVSEVFVNGVATIEGGKFLGNLSGEVLRKK